MTISFHCDFCGKKIDAKDESAGKYGKCPACQGKVRVPDPEEDEELKLAPLDETEEERKKRLMAETFRIEQEMLLEKETPSEYGAGVIPEASYEVSEKTLTTNIIMYLRHMADGQLAEAQQLEASIVRSGRKAMKILEQIALSEIPEPELSDVPQQVLSGFIRGLRGKIS